ncbi:MAG: PaaI family thioesterase [Candidatus Berkiella sp.]
MNKTAWNATLKLWVFGWLKVPMIAWVRPKVLELNNQRALIKIALSRRTKNHLRSMYFGALCVGADVTGGIHMMHFLNHQMSKLSFVFKDFTADFLKRPEADVVFICNDGPVIEATLNKAKLSKERENALINIIATTPSLSGDEAVARFTLTLSVKFKS